VIALERSDLVVGGIFARRLALEEIEDLGIDTSAPENLHIYDFEVTLVFQEAGEEESFHFGINGFGGFISKGGYSKPSGSAGSRHISSAQAIPVPDHPEVPPTLVFLVLPATVSYLKEFFEVSVVMKNMADPQFALDNSSVELQLPEGLSLAPTYNPRSALASLGSIAGGQEAAHSWVVRGDKPGSHHVTADFNGTLMPFGASVNMTLEHALSQYIQVLGSSGLSIIVYPDEIAVAGERYRVRFELRNSSSVPLYMLNFKVGINSGTGDAIDLDEVEGAPEFQDGDRVFVRELPAGESVSAHFYTTFLAAGAQITGKLLFLTLFFTETVNSFDYGMNRLLNERYVWLPSGQRYKFVLKDGAYVPDPLDDVRFESVSYNAYKFTYYDKTEYWFSSFGYLTKIVDPKGRATTLSYTDARLQSVASSAGALSFTWTNGHISKVSDNFGRFVTYEYDEASNLAGFTNPDGDRMEYTYNSSHNLTDITDFNGNDYIENTYDPLNRVVQQYMADQGTMEFRYSDSENKTTVTDGLGYEVVYRYSDYGMIESIEDGNGLASQTLENGLVMFSTDELGNVANYQYDSRGNRTKTVFPDGKSETATYNDKNMSALITARDGSSVSMTYDSTGVNVSSITDQVGNVTHFVHDQFGNLIRSIDPLSHETEYIYNSKGDCVEMIDSLGNSWKYAYNELGRLISETLPNEAATQYQYSPAGKLLKITDAYGGEKTFTVNGNGYETNVVDARGNSSSVAYNAMNKPIQATDALNGSVSFNYDEGGNLIGYTDALNNVTEYAYNSRRQLVSTTDALNNTWTVSYNAAGLPISETYPEGGVKYYQYNCLGQLILTIDENGAETATTYTDAGLEATVTDALSNKVTRSYSPAGKLVKEVDQLGNETAYAYNEIGLVSKVTDALNGVTSYTYNDLGMVIGRTPIMGQ
jgi:YD repeat-containing protein